MQLGDNALGKNRVAHTQKKSQTKITEYQVNKSEQNVLLDKPVDLSAWKSEFSNSLVKDIL